MTAASLPFPAAAIPAATLFAPVIPPGALTAGDEFSALIFAATAETIDATPATTPKPVTRPFPANGSPTAAAVSPSSTPLAAPATGDSSTALISPSFAGAPAKIVEAAPATAPQKQDVPIELDPQDSSKIEREPERLPSFFAGFSIPGFATPAEPPPQPLANVFAVLDAGAAVGPQPPLAEPVVADGELPPPPAEPVVADAELPAQPPLAEPVAAPAEEIGRAHV